MSTKSRVAKQGRKNHYGMSSSRRARTVTTLLAQVEDLERGQRIKARREKLRLTQPAVVDLVEQLAYELPDGHALHPDIAGKAPLTLRGYQQYERGGGIVWEKAKLLATALRMEADELMNGEKPETPDLFPFGDNEALLHAVYERLGRLEKRLEEVIGQRTKQTTDIIQRLADLENALSARTDALLPGIQELLAAAEESRHVGPAQTSRTGK